ncbi:MAG TPA: ABC transporter permease [Pyrinomonadaceae bacterium]|jgi:predicted permease|nr:ABC transporter permease [Pyrinomonadaceae bacterium]
MLEPLLKDIRHGFRGLLKRPGFTLIAVVTLALGIGANTAIFSLMDSVMLRSLPVDHPEQIVRMRTLRSAGGINQNFSYPFFQDVRKLNQVCSGLIAYYSTPLSLSGGDGPAERIYGTLASGDYFSVLGVNAARGRTFTMSEDSAEGASPVVVISHSLWQRRFGGAANVIGQQISLNNNQFTIIGVAPQSFSGLVRGLSTDLWLPLSMHAQAVPDDPADILSRRTLIWLEVAGRLKPGVDVAQASASIELLGQQIARANAQPGAQPSSEKLIFANGSKGATWLVEDLDTPIKILLVAAGFVLLIACANVANLLLVRGSSRRKEIAVKLALGASRMRIVRQLLIESMLLAVMGGVAGLLIALWTNDLWKVVKPADLFYAVTLDSSVNLRVLGFAVGLSLLTGLVFGIAPALDASRLDLVPSLKLESRMSRPERRFNLRSLLVVTQVALSFMLLIGAGLFIRTLRSIQHINVGYQRDHVLVATLDPSLHGYDRAKGQQLYESLLERVRTLPGVTGASLAATVSPNPGGGRIEDNIQIEGRLGQSDHLAVDYNRVGPEYFATMGMPLTDGRDFTLQDRKGSPEIAVINETLARKLFPNEKAVGKRIRFGDEDPFMEIVGVAQDAKYRSMRESALPCLYQPFLMVYRPEMNLLVRSQSDPVLLSGALRKELDNLDSRIPFFNVRTLDQQIKNATSQERAAAVLTSLFGGLALLLATIGLYGVMSYVVSQRTHDIGIRMALGAQVRDVLRLVLLNGMGLAFAGVLVGLAGALALTRLLRGLLFGVTPNDVLTFALVTAGLFVVALLACYLPARRAAKVDPLIALRYE